MADTGFETPTLAETVERIQDDLALQLPEEDVRVRSTETFAFSTALGGAVSGLQGFLVKLAGQALPDQATGTFLERHASIDGIFRLTPTFSKGKIRATGNIGVTIPDTTRWQLLSDGDVEWEQQGDFVIGGSGYVDVDVTALVSGPAGDAPVNSLVQLSDETAGIDFNGTVVQTIGGGDDLETDPSLQDRLLDKKREPPQGGSVADYVAWVKLIGGVSEVYVLENTPYRGAVEVRFTKTVPEGGSSVDAIPPTQDVLDAAASIEANRQVCVEVFVIEVAEESHTFDISIKPNTTAVQDAITAEINALFLRVGEPGGTVSLGELRGAIDSAAGEEKHTINLIDGSPPVEQAIPIGADGWPTIDLPISWSLWTP